MSFRKKRVMSSISVSDGRQTAKVAIADPRMPHHALSGLGADGVAHVGRRVDGDGAGRDLRDGHDVGEFGVGHPRVLYDHFVLDEREHRVTATEAEEPDFQVADEKLPGRSSPRLLSR